MVKPDHDVPAPKELTVIKLEVTVRTLGKPPTPEFENRVFDMLSAGAERALEPLGKGKISGVGWIRLDLPERTHRTVISLTTEQLEYFNSKKMPEESLPDAIDRLVADFFLDKEG